jgi:hypothetical protein
MLHSVGIEPPTSARGLLNRRQSGTARWCNRDRCRDVPSTNSSSCSGGVGSAWWHGFDGGV